MRQRDRTSMRRRKGTAPPGKPPYAHEGSLRRLIFFAYDRRSESVVVGPVGFRNALAPATWTYDVADAITDESLAASVDPTAAPSNWRRTGVGQISAATFGSAHYDANGAPALDWINETPEPHAVFPIILSQTGGMQGTPSMPATWQYSVTDAISGLTLSADTDPAAFPHEWRRPAAGKVTAATFGYASLSAGGVLTIGWINEVPEVPAVHVFPVNLVLAELASGGPDFPTNHMYNVFDASTGADLGQFVNPNTQSATATAIITVPVDTIMTVDWSGLGETEVPNFELMSLSVDGALVGSANAPGGGQGCAAMGPVVSNPPPPQQVTLTTGQHTLTITATTNDALYHFGAFYQFGLSFVAVV